MEEGVQSIFFLTSLNCHFVPFSILAERVRSPVCVCLCDPDLREQACQGMERLWSSATSRAQVLPMASEGLPMGNTTLTSIVVERTTAVVAVVYFCAGAHRETKLVRYDEGPLEWLRSLQ